MPDHPDPLVDAPPSSAHPPPRPTDVEAATADHEAQTITSGVPFPAQTGPFSLNPAPTDLTHQSTPSDVTNTHPAKPRSSSSNSSTVVETKKKSFAFGRKGKDKDVQDKKAKDKQDEADKIPAVGLFKLYRFAKPHETMWNIIGLILAVLAGAAQPLMTLIFGRLTTDFTNFAIATQEITSGGLTPERVALLEEAKASLKTQAGHNALYLMAIGIGMFLTTWAYMFIWNWTGEVNAKRVREKYLHATLRQEVSLSIRALR